MSAEERMCLLNPGPVTLSPRVRRAMERRDMCHREPEFAAIQADVRGRLERVYPNAHSVFSAVLFTGSGTAAVEAMVGSLVPRDGKALVVENGVYGERISEMLRILGRRHETARSEWTARIDLAAVDRRLASDRSISHVIAVHHETTTGRLNDIAALGALCRRRGVKLLLDAVSSFGGEQIDLDEWNIEACAATANKCLHGVPGICFVLARKAALESSPSAAGSLYLDLHRNHLEQQRGGTLFTPAVQSLHALQEALCEFEEQGGWEQRRCHYQELSRIARSGLRERGVQLLLSDEQHYSATLSSFWLNPDVQFNQLFDRLKKDGFIIYPGQHWLSERIFRIAVMGDLSSADMRTFLEAYSRATTS
jgi:2-aminoethylphosphonate-pyruvate transaminase